MSKYPKHCVTNKLILFKQNPSTEMSLNFEVNPLTTKIELFQTKLKIYKLFCEYYTIVHITIYLQINSKNPWLSYAKIQEILRALSTFTWVFSFCRIHYGIIVGPWDERLWGDQLRCMCYYKIVNKSPQHQSRFPKKRERMGGKE